MNRSALDGALEDINRLTNLIPRQVREANEMMRAIQRDREFLEAARGPAAHVAVLDAQRQWQQLVQLDSAQVRAMQDMMALLNRIPDQASAMQGFYDSLQDARAFLDLSSPGFLQYARDSLDAFLANVSSSSAMLDPARWLDEGIDELLADDPKYRQSRLAWILVMFVPRIRLALHEQDREGDFDGVMQAFWDDLLNDPQVRARLRERLETSGVREELRQFLSSHLDKIDAKEFMYAILGLYAHIDGFLAELAVERGLIPDTESVIRPDGSKKKRSGVFELIKILHANGQIDDSQEKFLTFVLSNEYEANRLRHGTGFGFTQERATALVLVLILVLCLSWGMEPDKLLDDGQDVEAEAWIDELLNKEADSQEAD